MPFANDVIKEAFKRYVPRNRLSVKYENDGRLSDTSLSHLVQIWYAGDVDLGEDTLVYSSMMDNPFYFLSALPERNSAYRRAQQETGITCCVPHDKASYCRGACMILCICPIICGIIECMNVSRYERLMECTIRNATEDTINGLVGFLKQADDLADKQIVLVRKRSQARLAEKQAADQLQLQQVKLLQQLVAQGSAAPITTQYKQVASSSPRTVEMVSPVTLGEIPPPAYTHSPSAPPL
jgi:hypothetical protein